MSKNILITGATSGIGRAVALECLKRGYKVAATGRRAELLAELKRAAPGRVFTYLHDVTTGGAAQIIAVADKEMDGVNIVLINAGYGDIDLDLKEEVELKTVNTNVFGFTDAACAAYRYFKKNGGGVLGAVSSIASFRGGWAAPAYNASKAFVGNYMEGLRVKSYREKSG
ncbi:MAG: SDR family NAD(P)-dependent oxidoreductase [Elusimicrobiota bacterium]|jgi:short-subunit dehydrogenase|nr:SDR family NAD(P)-dependent oxidoreductase [Elusimicrobiota bacterium]